MKAFLGLLSCLHPSFRFRRAGGHCNTLTNSILFCLAIAGVGSFASPCPAAIREWVGDDGGFWSNPNNWDPAGVPQNGDNLEFEDIGGTVAVLMHNDLVNLRTGHLSFVGGDWIVEGNEFFLGPSHAGTGGRVSVALGGCAFNGNLTLSADTTMELYTGVLRLNGTVALRTLDLSFICGSSVFLSGQVTGTGNILARTYGDSSGGNSLITFDGSMDNTFTGTLTVIHSGDLTEPGAVVFDKQAGAVVTAGLVLRDAGVCRLARFHQIGDNAAVCVATGGQFLLEGHTETIGSLCLTNASGDTKPSLVDTGGSTLLVQGDITAVNDASGIVPTIRGKLGLPVPAAASSKNAAPKKANYKEVSPLRCLGCTSPDLTATPSPISSTAPQQSMHFTK
jgi:hypothetical protein